MVGLGRTTPFSPSGARSAWPWTRSTEAHPGRSWSSSPGRPRVPDKVISTLAYQYSRRAPAGIKPEPNVNIMLCTIECNRSRPIETDPANASFRQDIRDWSR